MQFLTEKGYKLQWQRERRYQTYQTPLSSLNNLISVSGAQTYEACSSIHREACATSSNILTIDDEFVGGWTWEIQPLHTFCEDHQIGALISILLDHKDFQHLFLGDDLWLLGGVLGGISNHTEVIRRMVISSRVDPVLEYGVSGGIAIVNDNQYCSKYRKLPRRNYLQGIAYGYIEDPRIAPYRANGFLVSSIGTNEQVLLFAPHDRLARGVL